MPPRRSARASAATTSSSAAPKATNSKRTPTKAVKPPTPKKSPYFEHKSGSEQESDAEEKDTSVKKKGGWGWAAGRDKSTIGGWGKKGRGKQGPEEDVDEGKDEGEENDEEAEPKKKGGWGWAAGRDKSTIGGWGRKGRRAAGSKGEENDDASSNEGDEAADDAASAGEEDAPKTNKKGGWGWAAGRDKSTIGGWGKKGRGAASSNDDEDDEIAKATEEETPKSNKKGGWGWAAGRDKSTIGGWGKKGARGKQETSEESATDTQESAEDEHSEYDDATPPPKKGRGKRKLEDTSDDEEPASKRRGKPAKEIWREGVSTGLGPGKEVVFKRARARSPGDTDYSDETIHPNTFSFLKDLKANNDRDWLKAQDAEFRQSENDWKTFVDKLSEAIREKDGTIPELPVKDVIFRIYRDVRFSSDPTPYKPYFSAAWSRSGRKGPYAAYYVQIQPGGGSFVGSGLWHPEADRLALMRTDINENSEDLKQILVAPSLRKEFFGGIPNDEKKAVAAFIKGSNSDALKTKPKGFEADNPNIDLLRLRSFTIGKKLKDEEVIGRKGLDRIVQLISMLTPFVTYLNEVVMPE